MKKVFSKPPRFVYERFIAKQREGTSFIIFLFFFLAFASSRTWINLSILGWVPASFTQDVRGVHIHHFAYGILITSLAGYLTFVLPRRFFEAWKTKLAAVFGLGLGLTFDEFGMWLHLRDDYWIRQSYDAIIVVSVLLLNVIYFGRLWKKLAGKVYKEMTTRKRKTN